MKLKYLKVLIFKIFVVVKLKYLKVLIFKIIHSLDLNIFFVSPVKKNILALGFIMNHLHKNCQFSDDSKRSDTNLKYPNL